MKTRANKIIHVIVFAALMPTACSSVSVRQLASTNPAVSWLKTGLQESESQLDSQLNDKLSNPLDAPSKKLIESRDLTNGALTDLILNQNQHGRADQFLRLWFSSQDMNPDSPNFGIPPWNFRGPVINDPNTIEFGCQPLGAIFLRYKNLLSPSLQAQATTHLAAALTALKRHKVPLSYSNIFLMNTVNELLLSQFLDDADGLHQAKDKLSSWLQFTASHGITEYDSPTYYKVALIDLVDGYLYAQDSLLKSQFKMALDYYWMDIAANYFSGAQTLSGSHSRDYDFLNSQGPIDAFTYYYGLRPSFPEQNADLELASVLDSELHGGYRPQPAIQEMAAQSQKWIFQKWGNGSGQDRSNFITQDFSIGSSSRDYGPQDKSISIEFRSAKILTDVTVVMDNADAPYGKNLAADSSGHLKPGHLPLHPVSVQQKGKLLLLANAQPDRLNPTHSLATNVLLPTEADAIFLDTTKIKLAAGMKLPLQRTSVISVRQGHALVSIRPFFAAGCDPQKEKMVLMLDAKGQELATARLAIEHFQSPSANAPETCKARVGLLFKVSQSEPGTESAVITSLKNLPIHQSWDGKIWSVTTELDGDELSAATDESAQSIVHRRINGKEVGGAPMMVNGIEIPLFH